MSTDPHSSRNALLVRPITSEYEVGYGKPPAETRFRPGKSGNPRGRPKGSKNRPRPPALNEERLKAIILEEAYRTITVNDAEGPRAIPMAQAVIRSVAVNAAKGKQRAQRLFTELLASVEGSNRRLHDEWLDTAITYKVAWERELERRARLGISGPDPLPHPDHVIIDLGKGTAHIRGPATKEEKQQWDLWHKQKALFEEELKELRALRDDPEYPDQESLAAEIDQTERVLEIIAVVLVSGRVPETFPVLEPCDPTCSDFEHRRR
jgi:hypothetical protein